MNKKGQGVWLLVILITGAQLLWVGYQMFKTPNYQFGSCVLFMDKIELTILSNNEVYGFYSAMDENYKNYRLDYESLRNLTKKIPCSR